MFVVMSCGVVWRDVVPFNGVVPKMFRGEVRGMCSVPRGEVSVKVEVT